MPIYEYRCEGCGRKVSIFFRSIAAAQDAACPRCSSRRLVRLVSRFALGQSEEGRLERLADPSALAGLDENDPGSVARWMKRMGKELGEDAGEDFEQALAEMERGEPGEQPTGAGESPAEDNPGSKLDQ
ncbi:MAG: zinc ribbon domain-containing protein [Acidobacteriota bacterium]